MRVCVCVSCSCVTWVACFSAVENSRHKSKRERKEQRSTFREIRQTVEVRVCVCQCVCCVVFVTMADEEERDI
jgi:hypothetical protein